ncbi:hypothetical protein [Paraburkholderia silvatlantica]|uniref:Lipoprotein n=1 Tax=Paraburkholderia silvatlantica TaxID=321895 RepID=A0ABR6FJX9_9BURK|nr:hypothetical protein [Paraburkholderia silvatlantica]MBB2927090.1 hypothetical protein [Paraburkholderia silvatlantica]PVY36811.1 hypothetical protein C7411_102101 [Paraburkholderia silvatlantica]PXW41911.1 hypothetical protein C7413_102320 [Paraburkholderia silvatlantica]
MKTLFCVIALAGLSAGLTGCVVAPPYAYAPAPAYYGYAPGYYAAPAVDIGVGVGGYYGHGWRH